MERWLNTAQAGDRLRDRGDVVAVAPMGVLRDARTIIEDHFEDLMKNRLPKIAEATGIGIDGIGRALEALKRLSLAPGKRLVEERNEPIIPDAIVEYDEDNDRYIAYLTIRGCPGPAQPRVRADEQGPERAEAGPGLSQEEPEQRAVADGRGGAAAVDAAACRAGGRRGAAGGFDHGMGALKPLPMTQVAEQLGVHVATVSRAVAEKYLLTPHGVLPLRGFFTAGMSDRERARR
jgi:RNA polymerase sigma-54 factor